MHPLAAYLSTFFNWIWNMEKDCWDENLFQKCPPCKYSSGILHHSIAGLRVDRAFTIFVFLVRFHKYILEVLHNNARSTILRLLFVFLRFMALYDHIVEFILVLFTLIILHLHCN